MTVDNNVTLTPIIPIQYRFFFSILTHQRFLSSLGIMPVLRGALNYLLAKAITTTPCQLISLRGH